MPSFPGAYFEAYSNKLRYNSSKSLRTSFVINDYRLKFSTLQLNSVCPLSEVVRLSLEHYMD